MWEWRMDEDWWTDTDEEQDAAPTVESSYRECVWIEGRRVSPYDCPECLDTHEFNCNQCDFFAEWDCPLLRNPILIDDIRTIFDIHREWRAEQVRRQQAFLRAIHAELREHGRPLHYTVLASIVADRYPELEVSESSVRGFLAYHPDLFERVAEGVYRTP